MQTLLAASLLTALVLVPTAAGADDFVPFVIPADVNPASEIAFRGEPIAVDSPRVVVRDGHFFVGDKRLRIWGVNCCFGANFPTHDEAERIAARLEAFGVNSVRFHHMDHSPFPNGIWDPKDNRKLSDEALDRLDYFLDRLARRGIYANLNLHVSRNHGTVLELPDSKSDYDKIVDIFTPQLIDAQKDYARRLLTHVNAYRKVRYADDPAVAFVEINNENSLFMWGAESKLPNLPEFYAKILAGQWQDWLKAKYGATDKLAGAWNARAEPLGENVLAGFSATRDDGAPAWNLERHGQCAAKSAVTDAGLSVTISRADGTDWHIQLNQSGLKLREGQYYTLTFSARADRARPLGVTVQQAHEPWASLGLSQRVSLTTEWKQFRLGFTASAGDDNARVNFSMGTRDAGVTFGPVQLRTGGQVGLAKGERLEDRNVVLFADCEVPARELDRMRFLAETEKAYFSGMRGFVRDDLGCKALVTGTIVFGPLGLWAQGEMDFIDAHAYWQHPHFPGRPWDPGNWIVEPRAMVDKPGQSTLPGLASARQAGKPFTVSEYNHPAPNPYQAECVPMIAAFAACQDWDGVWLFAYSHRTGANGFDHYDSFFDIAANPSKWGFVPAGTALFRNGRASRESQTIRGVDWLRRGEDELAALHAKYGSNLLRAAVYDYERVMGLSRTKNGEGFVWTKNPTGWTWTAGDGALLTAGGPDAFVLVTKGKPDVESGNRFAVVTATPLDGKALDDSKRLLVAVCARCENTDMKFSADLRTVGRKWGKGPVRVEIPRMEIPLPGRGWTCRALKPDGMGGADVALTVKEDSSMHLPVSAKDGTMWYLLTRE
ncbi:MAG TPA: carbohydrate binding domain-containing protein [Phycisphaerae bacterium]|nr:carbohydrate binding domain-containing protein [Phycisphaerae bacterium]